METPNIVLACIDFYTEKVLTTKTIKVFPNQNPWTETVRSLLRVRDAAFRAGDCMERTEYKKRIEGHFQNNPHSIWRGIKTLTNYKSRNLKQPKPPPLLLGHFYRSTMKSILCHCVTQKRWRKSPQRLERTVLPNLVRVFGGRIQGCQQRQ